MQRDGVSVERVRFTDYKQGVTEILRAYHRSVAEGHQRYLSQHDASYEFSPEAYIQGEVEKDLAYFAENAPVQSLVVALDGSSIVGCVYLYALSETEGEIKRLYVAESHRRSGLGRHLMKRLIEYAETAGYDSLRLDTAPYMDSAQRLYKELGFSTYEGGESITDVPGPVLNNLVFMRRQLENRQPR